MTFIVTLIALLIERFFDWSHLRHWGWYVKYQRTIVARCSKLSSYALLAAVLAPLVLGAVLVQYLLQGWFYGLASLVFQLIILLYCLGPQNLWADAFACITSLAQDGPGVAAEKLKAMFGLSEGGTVQNLRTNFLGSIFVQANNRVFSVIFWYVILGPAGAILYRATAAASVTNTTQEVVPELAQPAHTLEELLSWLPARLFALIFALAGHFSQVFSCWRKFATAGLTGNETLIAGCGIAALGRDDQEKIAADGSVERNAVNLLDRAYVIVLVLVLIITLVQ